MPLTGRRTCEHTSRKWTNTVLWSQFKKLTTGFPEEERAAIFYDTALGVYQLEARSGGPTARRI